MSASGFIAYASSGCLSEDATYTVELLIERVRSKFDPDYWSGSSDRDDAREAPGYKPSFLKDYVPLAAAELQNLSWISFQRLSGAVRPIRDISALRYLPGLTTVVLIDNEVTDLTPLQDCKKLRALHLRKNPCQNISPLARCGNLEELLLGNTRVDDAEVLGKLPNLRDLSISLEQNPTFKAVERLSALTKLDLEDGFDSFAAFPDLPKIQVIRGANVLSLDGLQRFPTIANLVNLAGSFDSLEPLADAKELTHVNILDCRVSSLQPFSRLFALREIYLNTEADDLDLQPLERLPALHRVRIKCSGHEPLSLAKLQSQLTSWDVEFWSDQPRHVPALDVQVVEQKEFDHYDGTASYGVDSSDTNESLLSSELEWLDEHLEGVFAPDFKKDEDYTIPFQWAGARSRTVVLLSEPAISAFSRLVLGLQNVLCHYRRDWIIYFQSDDAEPYFVVWVYADKIVVTEEHAATINDLISMG